MRCDVLFRNVYFVKKRQLKSCLLNVIKKPILGTITRDNYSHRRVGISVMYCGTNVDDDMIALFQKAYFGIEPIFAQTYAN